MDNIETTETNSAKDFGKAVAMETAKTVAVTAAGLAVFMGATYAYSKLEDFRAARAAKKAENE